jgi:hypothetical protein
LFEDTLLNATQRLQTVPMIATLWGAWILASLAGGAVGSAWNDGRLAVFQPGSLLFPALMALAQGLVLLRMGVVAGVWVAVTSAAAPIAGVLAYFLTLVLGLQPHGPPALSPPDPVLQRKVIYGLTVGLLVGCAQGAVLLAVSPRALVWLVVSAMGGVGIVFAGDLNAVSQSTPAGWLNGAVAGAVYGAVTGLPLAVLVRKPRFPPRSTGNAGTVTPAAGVSALQ